MSCRSQKNTLIPRELIMNIVNKNKAKVTFKRGNEISQYWRSVAEPMINAARVTAYVYLFAPAAFPNPVLMDAEYLVPPTLLPWGCIVPAHRNIGTHQYVIPTTIAKSGSTKARTNSIMALDIGHSTIISQTPSITNIATSPTTPKAMRTPPGPDIASTSPLVVANPSPIVPLNVMNFSM